MFLLHTTPEYVFLLYTTPEHVSALHQPLLLLYCPDPTLSHTASAGEEGEGGGKPNRGKGGDNKRKKGKGGDSKGAPQHQFY